MSIPITCNGCGSKLRAPDKTAGRTIPCPNCKTSCIVPSVTSPTPLATATPQQAVSVQSPETKALIPCETCQKAMAVTAKACPACGATNTWVHPDIVRFNQQIDQRQLKAPAQFYSTSTFVHGNATVKREKLQNTLGGWSLIIVGIAPFLLSYIGFVSKHPKWFIRTFGEKEEVVISPSHMGSYFSMENKPCVSGSCFFQTTLG